MDEPQHNPPAEPLIPEPQPLDMVEKEKYLRLAADFENYKRSQAQQMQEREDLGKTSLAYAVVENVESLARAIRTYPPEMKEQFAGWLQGMELIASQIEKSLAEQGIQRIKTVGEVFDPTKMEAIQVVPDGPSHTVKEEVKAGWMLRERVFRPAQVIIYE